MEKFRKTIEFRRTVLCIFVLVISLLTLTHWFIDFGIAVSEHLWAFVLGLLSGTADVVGVYFLVTYMLALYDESRLQALYIEETDERNILIRTKTGGMAVNIIMATLVCAAIVAMIFSLVVFFTLIGTLLFTALLKLTLKLYYRKKI
jgi:hypothetical protein